MLTLSAPSPVKVIVAAFWNDETAWNLSVSRMCELWGEVDNFDRGRPFTASDYYEPEMGTEIRRQLLSFTKLADPARLPDLKLATNRLEKEFSREGGRTVNLDVGYLDLHKLVLASTKEGPQKIYMGKGIWADLTLTYRKKSFHSLPWTFPDFAGHLYDSFLLSARMKYKQQVRHMDTGHGHPSAPL